MCLLLPHSEIRHKSTTKGPKAEPNLRHDIPMDEEPAQTTLQLLGRTICAVSVEIYVHKDATGHSSCDPRPETSVDVY